MTREIGDERQRLVARVAMLEEALRDAPRPTPDPVAYMDWFMVTRGHAIAGTKPAEQIVREMRDAWPDRQASRPQEQPRKATGEMLDAAYRVWIGWRDIRGAGWRGGLEAAINAALAVSVSPAAAQMADAAPDSALLPALVAAEKALRPFATALTDLDLERIAKWDTVEGARFSANPLVTDYLAAREAHALIQAALGRRITND